MVRPSRIIILSVISISLGAVIYKVAETLWLQKVMEFQEDPVKILDLLPQPTLQLKEFRRSKVEEGRKVWEITGDEAVYIKAEREAVITSPRLVFYNENNENGVNDVKTLDELFEKLKNLDTKSSWIQMVQIQKWLNY